MILQLQLFIRNKTNIENDKVTVSKISASDLKTNEYYGSDCSQVINMISYGGLKTTIIINRN